MSNTEIHVAIPVYNNVAGLRRLLPQLQQQNFSSITVLDDASTDTTPAYVKSLPDVEYIRAPHNLGTVGANNLQLQSPHSGGFLLCLDSDMELVTTDIVGQFSQWIRAHPQTAAVVGKIVDQAGNRVRWNFGYDINPWRSVFACITYYAAVWLAGVPYVGNGLRRVSTLFTLHLAADIPQKVDWGIEGFFFVRQDVWRKQKGFDSRFKRFHEGPDLFLTLRTQGYETWYLPQLVARDSDQASHSSWYRAYHWWRSTLIYFYKHPSRLLIYRWPRP